jgi:hypothetical protein
MYGKLLNFQTAEFWAMPLGEIMDLIKCYQIHEGIAKPKETIDDDQMIPDIP